MVPVGVESIGIADSLPDGFIVVFQDRAAMLALDGGKLDLRAAKTAVLGAGHD
jgi:hypothetical protein